jgi:sugar lactone lactonase YvrE
MFRRKNRFVLMALVVMLLMGIPAATTFARAPGGPNGLHTVATFSPGAFPESLAIAANGDMYVSLGFSREVMRISPDGQQQDSFATLDVGNGLITGLALDPTGNLYVAVATFSTELEPYVAKIAPDGSRTTLATLPEGSFPNGVAFRDGYLYVSDSDLATIWRIDEYGKVDPWLWDPRLAPTKSIGANGIAFDDTGHLWIAVSDSGSILRVALAEDGSATLELIRQSGSLKTADGVAFDVNGDLYITVNNTNALYVLRSNDGKLCRLASAVNGLSYPTQPAFGRTAETMETLFITNGALKHGTADLVSMQLDVKGLPLP